MIMKATRPVTVRNGTETERFTDFSETQSFCGHKKLKKPVAPFLIWWLLIVGVVAICYVSS